MSAPGVTLFTRRAPLSLPCPLQKLPAGLVVPVHSLLGFEQGFPPMLQPPSVWQMPVNAHGLPDARWQGRTDGTRLPPSA